MNLWGHRFSQNPNQKLQRVLPYPLINFQGRSLYNFWLGFWKKRWPHKFILNLTDLYLEWYSLKSSKVQGESWCHMVSFWNAHHSWMINSRDWEGLWNVIFFAAWYKINVHNSRQSCWKSCKSPLISSLNKGSADSITILTL